MGSRGDIIGYCAATKNEDSQYQKELNQHDNSWATITRRFTALDDILLDQIWLV